VKRRVELVDQHLSDYAQQCRRRLWTDDGCSGDSLLRI
jgi:hypothetical protein